MTYITSANRTVLFGGNFNEAPYYFGDTWEWDGDGWVQVSDTGPTPRASPKLAYDADRNVAVLFGGYANGEHVFDTWEWDSQGWVQVGDTGPKAQGWEAAMVYDTARKLTTLEGGSIRTKGVGTWTWDGASWTQVADTGPELRANFPLAFDSTRERAVLFGGASPNVFEPKRDTWEWDGDAWTEVDDIGPPARQAHAMTWKGDDVVLFGGTAQQFSEGFADTWEWDGEHWRQRQDIGPHRSYAAVVWDSARSRVVLFGGLENQEPMGETWEAFEHP